MRILLIAAALLACGCAGQSLQCDSTAGGVCTISTPQPALPDGVWTCCDSSTHSLILQTSLICGGSNCGFAINVANDVTLNGGAKMYGIGGSLYTLSITAGGKISLGAGTNLSAPVIHLTSTLVDGVNSGVSCTSSYLGASATQSRVAGPGTPTGAGATPSYSDGGRGLGAAHAGAGATGSDSSPRSLSLASQTYPSNPFALPETGDINQLMGSLGGANNISAIKYPGINLPGQGGGVVWLTAATSPILLNGCTMEASGGYGLDAGGGSGGSIIVDGASITVAGGTSTRAHGGGTFGTVTGTGCNGVPCGLPGGGATCLLAHPPVPRA